MGGATRASDAYEGWIVVCYERSDCPPAENEGLYEFLEVPAFGQDVQVDSRAKWVALQRGSFRYSGDRRE